LSIIKSYVLENTLVRYDSIKSLMRYLLVAVSLLFVFFIKMKIYDDEHKI